MAVPGHRALGKPYGKEHFPQFGLIVAERTLTGPHVCVQGEEVL